MTMPSTPEGLLLVIGAIFLSIGILGGGFELSAIKIPPVGNYPRIFAFITGMGFIVIALKSNLPVDLPHDRPTQSPSPSATEQPRAQPPFISASAVISAVSPILPQPSQTITITGSGFGTQAPYDGVSPFIMITDVTQNWNAGWSGSDGSNLVTLSISSWTDTQIAIQGFTGRYGQNNWTLNNGDHVTVKVWNPQTGAGPSNCRRIVGSASSRCDEPG
jgi:hypothetical protein